VATAAAGLLAVEPIAASLLEPVARWGPSGAAAAVVGTTTADVLPAGVAVAVLLAWTAACVGAGAAALERREL
jgi:hypothetical protein